MSRWAEDFKNHHVHAKLEQVNQILKQKAASKDADEMIETRRLTKVLKLIADRINSADPEVTSSSDLDVIAQGLEHPNLRQELEQYVSQGGLGFIQSANNHLTSLLPSVHRLAPVNHLSGSPPGKDTEVHFDNFTQLVSAQQKLLDERIDEQTQTLATLQGQSKELHESLKSVQEEISAASKQWGAEFSADQAKRQTEFTTAQDSKHSEFTNWFGDFKNTSQDHFKTVSESFADQISKLTEDGKAKHQTILELHELVAGDAVAAGYLGDGKKERDAANFWRWATYFFVLATAGWLTFMFAFPYIYEKDVGEPWIYLLKSASVTGVLMFGAAYASRQSKSHRDQERRARWFGLVTCH